MNNIFQQSRDFNMDRLVHHGIYKGGAHSETSADLVIVKGSMFLGGAYPFALDVKGGE